MPSCDLCGASFRHGAKACPACKAPVKRSEGRYVDPNHGRCEFNDHGARCGGTGSIALAVSENAQWYCRKHALGITGMEPKSSRREINVKEHLEAVREMMAERRAIQGEGDGA